MDESEADLYQALLGYLAKNREAMDTLDGIAEWWVMRQRIHTSVNTVERVLRQMIEDGLVEEVGPFEPPRYRLRKRRKVNGGEAH